MLRHRNFQSVIGPLTLEAAFYSIFTFNFRFNRALISHSGAVVRLGNCLLYTSDAADDTPCVDLGGRRIIKKKLNADFKGVKRLFRIQSHFENFYVEPQHLND